MGSRRKYSDWRLMDVSGTSNPRVGAQFAGYRIKSLIARGGMGEVYLAEQDSPRRKVALKLLSPELSEDAGFRERFSRESEAAASIDHPNVIPIYQSGEANGALYIAMRYVEGTDLGTLLAEQGPLEPERVVRICAQIADALEAAHERGLVHRDVKPANILVGRSDHTYLSDFGLIRRSEVSTAITKTGQFMGTIDYVAPEQIRGEAVDGRADVYSLGCVLFECLTGEPPFRRDTEVATLYAHLEDPPPAPSARVPTVSPGLDEVVARAMAKRPDERFATAADLETSLRATAGHPVDAATRRSPMRARRWLVGAIGVMALVVLAAIAIIARGDRDPVASAGTSRPPINSAIEIDPNTMKIVSTVPGLPRGCARAELDAGEGNVWWLAGESLTRIDEETREARPPISLLTNGCNNWNLAVGFRTIWVANRLGLQPVDPANGQLLREIRLPIPKSAQESIIPQFMTNDVAAGAGAIWATSGVGDGLARVDPATRDPILVPVKGATDGVAFGEGAVWIIDRLDSTVTKIDPRTSEVIDRVELDGSVDAITVGEGAVWILDSAAGAVTPLNPTTLESSGPIRVGTSPNDIAAGLDAVWVANEGDGTVSRVDAETRHVTTVDVNRPVTSVVVDETTGTVWAAVAELHE